MEIKYDNYKVEITPISIDGTVDLKIISFIGSEKIHLYEVMTKKEAEQLNKELEVAIKATPDI